MSEEVSVSKLGIIRCWFNGKNGYGYIHPEDGSEAVFVHYTCMAPGVEGIAFLNEGVWVTYEVVRKKLGGLWAQNVRVAG